jgi:outer membrane protein assembly factor BamB
VPRDENLSRAVDLKWSSLHIVLFMRQRHHHGTRAGADMDNTCASRGLLLLVLGLSVAPAGAVTPIWQQEWTSLAPPTLAIGPSYVESHQFPSTIRFAEEGDLLVSGLSYVGDQSDVFRVSADGALRWAARIPTDGFEGAARVWPAADGGALVAGDSLGWIVKLDAAGALEWTRRVPSQWIAALPDARIATATCKFLTALELHSGEVAWQKALPIPGYPSGCEMTGMLETADDALVFSIEAYSTVPTRVSHTFKFDSAGNLLWQYTNADDSAHLIGVDTGKVFVATDTQLIALDAATGAALWQSDPLAGEALLIAGNPATPVIVGTDAVRGLAPDSGAVQWTHAIAVDELASAVGGALLVNTINGLVKLAADTGAIQWTTSLPDTDLFGHPLESLLGLGGLYQGQFTIVARVAAPGAQPPPFTQRIDFLSGQLATHTPIPPIEQGNLGSSTLADGYLVSMTVEQDAQATRYRLSKVDALDGTEVWSRIEPPFEPTLLNSQFGAGSLLAVRDGIIAASFGEGYYPDANVAVGMWDMADGALRWRVDLSPAEEEWRNTSISAPKIDDHSDLFVSLSTYVPCEFPDICAQTVLSKLDGDTGSIQWQHNESIVSQFEPPHLSNPLFLLLGDDVILEGSWGLLLRLNGTDGSVLWTASTLDLGSIGSLHLTSDGNLIAVGYRRWAKFDASSGAMLWSATSPGWTCFPEHCGNPLTIQLPDGNLLQFGSKRNSIGESKALVALLHIDGSGTFDLWFPEENSPLRPLIRDAEVDADGQIWMKVRDRLVGGRHSLWSLSRFDLDTGELEGRQAMHPYSDSSMTPYYFNPHLLSAPENDRLPVVIDISEPPLPARNGIAVLDTSVSATGNLSIDASISPGPVMPGEEVPFRVSAQYSGSSGIDPVEVGVVLPWGSGLAAVSCSAPAGGPCEIETRDGDLHARFPIEPGEVIDVQGRVRVLDSAGSAPVLSALVNGPTGLLEQDTRDNFVVLPVKQSLFRDGFEPRPSDQ